MHPTRRGRRSRAAVGVVVAAGLTLAACGNVITTDVNGRTAVARGPDGQPVAVVQVCDGETDDVRMSEGREGLAPDEPNPQVAELSTSEARTGRVVVDLSDPDPSWSGAPAPSRLDPAMLYIAYATWSDHDTQTSQVSFRGRQLAALEPDEVLVGRAVVLPLTSLEAYACSDD